MPNKESTTDNNAALALFKSLQPLGVADAKMSKPKPVKCCNTCKHHAIELCEDDAGNKVPRALTVSNQEPFWTYETCAKNWGLPKVACVDGSKCQLWIFSNKGA